MNLPQIISDLREIALCCGQAADRLSAAQPSRKVTHRNLSAASRKKISVAQKKRWSVTRGGKAA